MFDSMKYKMARMRNTTVENPKESGLFSFLGKDETMNVAKWIAITTIFYLLISDFLIFTDVFGFENGEFVDFILFNLSLASMPYVLGISFTVPIFLLIIYMLSIMTIAMLQLLLKDETRQMSSLKKMAQLLTSKKCALIIILFIFQVIELAVCWYANQQDIYTANIYFTMLIILSNIILSIITASTMFFSLDMLNSILIKHLSVTAILSTILYICSYEEYILILLVLLLLQMITIIAAISREFAEVLKIKRKSIAAIKHYLLITLILTAMIMSFLAGNHWKQIVFQKDRQSGILSLFMNTKFLIDNKEKLEINLDKSQLDNICTKLHERNIHINKNRIIENTKITFENNNSIKVLPVSDKLKLYFAQTDAVKKENNKTIPAKYAEVYVVKQRDLENNCTKCTELIGMSVYELNN